MITVRFPTGFSVQYNSGTKGHYRQDGWCEIRTPDDGWIASIPPTAIVEAAPPCRTYNAVNESQLQNLEKEIRHLKRAISKLAAQST